MYNSMVHSTSRVAGMITQLVKKLPTFMGP